MFLFFWQVAQGKIALQGLQHISGIDDLDQLQALPTSLQSLTFHRSFNQRLDEYFMRTNLPKLERLTFGDRFNQPLDQCVSLPRNLIHLTFGWEFNERLDGIEWPSRLQTLTLGNYFNHTLVGVTFPESLMTLRFGCGFKRSMEGVKLPNGLQTLIFGNYFNQSLETTIWPTGLQSLSFGHLAFYWLLLIYADFWSLSEQIHREKCFICFEFKPSLEPSWPSFSHRTVVQSISGDGEFSCRASTFDLGRCLQPSDWSSAMATKATKLNVWSPI